jgi:FkbM family methyltransferase
VTMAGLLHRSFVRLSEAALPARSAERLRQMVRKRRSRHHQQVRASREVLWQRQAGRGNVVVTLQPRVRMRLYYDSVLCRHIYLDDFEADERRFVNLFLRPGDIFVDVGANIGLFTLIAARSVGAQGRVYAFEPCAKTFQRLEDNVRLNRFQNVICSQAALSDTSEPMQMVVSIDGLDAWNSFAKPYLGEKFATEPVTVAKWDDFSTANQLSRRVALMKIDVEGWEEKVLRGAKDELSSPDAPVLQVEFTDAAAQAAGFSCRDVYRLLNSMGYAIYRFEPESNSLVPDPIRETYPYCNLFAVKDLDAAQRRLKG